MVPMNSAAGERGLIDMDASHAMRKIAAREISIEASEYIAKKKSMARVQ